MISGPLLILFRAHTAEEGGERERNFFQKKTDVKSGGGRKKETHSGM